MILHDEYIYFRCYMYILLKTLLLEEQHFGFITFTCNRVSVLECSIWVPPPLPSAFIYRVCRNAAYMMHTVLQHRSAANAWQIFGITWKITIGVRENELWSFCEECSLLFFFILKDVQRKYLFVKHVQRYTEKEHAHTPLQSTTKAAACWLGANKASYVFWFLMEKQNCKKESLALCLVSAPFRNRKRFEISKSHETAAALSFNCGWSSKPCSSFDRGKVNSLHRVHTGRCEGRAAWPTLRGTARVGWKKKIQLARNK